jgi:succinoglycan biosynthesis transport protein ExoP
MATNDSKLIPAREPLATGTSGLRPADIYYILFRHKWKILIVSLLGIVAAATVWVRWPRSYESSSELLIKYIQDAKTPTPNADTAMRPSEDIINPELELLRSRDLAERVVDTMTPKVILAKVDGGTDRAKAIDIVGAGISVEELNRSSVIIVRFKNSDQTLVQPVLRTIIDSYFKLHDELHRIGELDVPLSKEADQWRSDLLKTEADIRSAQTNAGIISLEDTKKSYSEEMNDIRRQLSAVGAEFTERKAILEAALANVHQDVTVKTNEDSIPDSVLEDYRRVRRLVEFWKKQHADNEFTYVEGSSKLKDIESQLAEAGKQQKKLEDEYPGLLAEAPPANDTDAGQRKTIAAQQAELQNLQIKIKVLNARMEDIKNGVASLSSFEERTTDLTRRQKLDQETYEQFARAVAQTRIAERFRNGQVWNISPIQTPTPPSMVAPGKRTKTAGMILFGAIGGILALVLFIEMYLDQTLKREVDVETHLRLPLFMNIPMLGKNGKTRTLSRGRKTPLLAEKVEATSPDGVGGVSDGGSAAVPNGRALQKNGDFEPAPWDPHHSIRCYSEALRDRLITYFEVNNLTHTPKLVAVTSCAGQAGVSTIAAGLAASLSETGEGNVLLVDMNELGAAHQFYKGELACGIDDALEKGKRDEALVQDNLYVVIEETSNDNLPRALPKRFKHLVPRLRASDYDYIIFDMPPVSQLSVTPRLARFMDMVLMVVESEKTDRDVVKRATSLLTEAEARVGVVLNKSKSYVPSLLTQQS